jgi:excisionase family DNA binding protein
VMMTVLEAGRRVGRDPETVRRWIRSGRLPSTKVGTRHLIEADDVAPFEEDGSDPLPMPREWDRTWTSAPMPDVVKMVRRSRHAH